MQILPNDLKNQVMRFLPMEDLVRSQLISKEWCASVRSNEHVWKQHLEALEEVIEEQDELVQSASKRRCAPSHMKVKEAYRVHVQCAGFFEQIGNFYPTVCPERVEALKLWELKHGVKLPRSMFNFFKRHSIFTIVHHCYPTNNSLEGILDLVPRFEDGNVCLLFLNENQGCCFWEARWPIERIQNPPVDPPVYVLTNHPDWEETDEEGCQDGTFASSHFSSFWEEMAVEGNKWYTEHSGYRGSWETYGIPAGEAF